MHALDQAYDKMTSAGLGQNTIARLQAIRNSAKTVDAVHAGIKKAAMASEMSSGANMLLFPTNQSSPRGILDIIETCGFLLLARAGEIGTEIWQRHLIFAEDYVGKSYRDKMLSGRYSTFNSLVESFEKPTERLVAVHLSNGLIASGMSFGDACAGTDVTVWPQTCGLANGEIPYSLTPLVSAYCDSDIWQSYPKAFAARVTGTLVCGHPDVAEKFKSVIDSVSCAGECS